MTTAVKLTYKPVGMLLGAGAGVISGEGLTSLLEPPGGWRGASTAGF